MVDKRYGEEEKRKCRSKSEKKKRGDEYSILEPIFFGLNLKSKRDCPLLITF